jgi:F-type H+-transporting ATPase subunit b
MNFSEIINPQPGSIFWTLITFIILVIVLRRFVWGPLTAALKSREDGIRQDIDDAKKQNEEAEKLRLRNEEMLLSARTEAQVILGDARKRAQAQEEERKQLLEVEVEKLRDRAKAEIEQEGNKVIEQIREQAVDLVTASAQAMLTRSLTEADREEIVRQTLDKLKS